MVPGVKRVHYCRNMTLFWYHVGRITPIIRDPVFIIVFKRPSVNVTWIESHIWYECQCYFMFIIGPARTRFIASVTPLIRDSVLFNVHFGLMEPSFNVLWSESHRRCQFRCYSVFIIGPTWPFFTLHGQKIHIDGTNFDVNRCSLLALGAKFDASIWVLITMDPFH